MLDNVDASMEAFMHAADLGGALMELSDERPVTVFLPSEEFVELLEIDRHFLEKNGIVVVEKLL